MESLLIYESNFDKARKKIREGKKSGKRIIFSGNDDELNRKILEKEDIDILLPSLRGRKDRMKQRDSGFNHVLAKIAKKKNIIIGIDFREILQAGFKEKSDLLGRVRQNIKLANKNKLKMTFILEKEKDIHDMKALGLVLGMPTSMTKNL